MIPTRRASDVPRLQRERLKAKAVQFAKDGRDPAFIARKLDVASMDVRRWLAGIEPAGDDGDDE